MCMTFILFKDILRETENMGDNFNTTIKNIQFTLGNR